MISKRVLDFIYKNKYALESMIEQGKQSVQPNAEELNAHILRLNDMNRIIEIYLEEHGAINE